MAREVLALEGANWQRSKSKKAPPKQITRPKEIRKTGAEPTTAAGLQARKQRFKQMRKAVS